MGKSLAVLFAFVSIAVAGCGEAGSDSESDPDIVGTYTVDRDAFRPVFLEQIRKDYLDRPGGLGEENEAHLQATVDGVVDSMQLDLVISADGTFELNQLMLGKPQRLEGTWKQDGDAVVFTATKKDGVVQKKPGLKRASLKGGVLHMRRDPALPFEFLMRRK